jgi:plastocyanin domain-containing protein
MGTIVVTRTGVVAGSTSFQALSALAASTVSSSFTVASGMTKIKMLTCGQAVDATGESFQALIKISGNALQNGDAVFTVGGQNVVGTSTGTNQNYVTIETDLDVVPGNSCEISYAQVGDTATVDVAATLQFSS